MQFLKPFMKNRKTVGYPNNSEESQAIEQDDNGSAESNLDEVTQNEISSAGTDETVTANEKKRTIHSDTDQTVVPNKKRKPLSLNSDPILKKYLETSENRAKERDMLRLSLAKQENQQNDGLYQFFLSMYNITKSLPIKYQRQVRRHIFHAVSQAEDDADHQPHQTVELGPSSSSSTSSTMQNSNNELLTQDFPVLFNTESQTFHAAQENESCCSQIFLSL